MYHIHKMNVYVNEIWFLHVHIHEHVFERHGESITTEIILNLIRQLHFGKFKVEARDEKNWQYFATHQTLNRKSYRLVWCIPPDADFLGVRTAFRKD